MAQSSDSYVFFVGDVALDEYYRTERFPKIREKVIVHTLPAQTGGMIANAACVHAGYGAATKFMTALNSGPVSRRLCDDLAAHGLDMEHMVVDDTLPDAKTIIILAEGEHTVFIPTLGIQRIEISASALDALCAARHIYSTFCEIRPLRCGDMDVRDILTKARDNGCDWWCDLDVADIGADEHWLLEHVGVLFLNEIGFRNILTGADERTTLDYLFAKGIETVVVTHAGDGCRVYRRGEEFHVPGIRVEPVDVTGAGDTFCSTFLHAFDKTADLRLSAEFANYAAARSVTMLGARSGACGVEAVLDFIRDSGGDASLFSALR
jgi:Sugar kinases, ribokinase family